ncbi:MAG TPA: histidine--tRNA ligase [Kofleriaceae bacterium]|nr:histidine--tRNA ligase [Kofleriaceae bacterium]
MPVQPRTPPGVLELLPPYQLAFQRMLDTIRRGFERFGFLPVETPAFELTDVLLTKEGGETEKQVYFVQSTGSLEKARASADDAKRPELALRFDLTVPLARYVAEHEHDLNFPFRRYQIQRVYRGERNQKGRYREFYQCDIDAIGKDTLPLAYDAEMPAVIYGVFTELAFGAFTIHVNNRKLLRGILESLGIAVDQHAAVLHEVDRLGKQDRAKVEAALAGEGVGLAPAIAGKLLDTLTAHAGDSRATLDMLRRFENPSPAFTEGLAELARVYEGTLALGVPEAACTLNLSIVRGLDYYTGTVYETFLDAHRELGSICSGGRYENLAGHYTKSKLPGVGISIGATRLFYQLMQMKLIDVSRQSIAQAIVLAVEPPLAATYAALGTELRQAGLNVEVYGGDDKLGKQLKYADRGKIPLAILLGQREAAAGVVKIKDLRANAEHEVARDQLVERVRELLARSEPAVVR